MFRREAFLRFMNENYRMLPFLFSPRFLREFKNEISASKEAQDFLEIWFRKEPNEKKEEILKLNMTFPMFSISSFCYLKPFLELYLKYISTKHKKELEISRKLSRISDLREPHAWFPETRTMKRKFIYHHGPTNSGKTYSALLELEKAEKGIYCGPLRLLAWEIQDKLENKGIPCNLITGQEKIMREDAKIVSCTIECANFQQNFDVALIDEIQMIGDIERGSSWTLAVLGLKAKEIHLCGDERALSLINKLCTITGDDLEERKYTRFSQLFVEKDLFNLKTDLRPGDCIIAFSVRDVHKLKNYINYFYGNNTINCCSIVYGRLPPENKKDQTRKFNDPTTEIKYLCATNAIGMGLNLKIKRIIFSSLQKITKDGRKAHIADHEIRQIGGRAGRYKENGRIACMKTSDLLFVKSAFKELNIKPVKSLFKQKMEEEEENLLFSDLNERFRSAKAANETSQKLITRMLNTTEKSIKKAILFPLYNQIEEFAEELENIEKKKLNLSYIFQIFMTVARFQDIYSLQRVLEFCEIADIIQDCDLSLKDHFTFSSAPLNLSNVWTLTKKQFYNYAKDYQNFNRVPLNLQLEEKSNHLKYNESDLIKFEELHHISDVYIWLAHKYEHAFFEKEKAIKLKKSATDIIDSILDSINIS